MVRLGPMLQPPLVDCRVISEDLYQKMLKLIDDARWLVGNPGTNISGSTDMACDTWQQEYSEWEADE